MVLLLTEIPGFRYTGALGKSAASSSSLQIGSPAKWQQSGTRHSEWRNDSRSSKVEVDFTSPGLAVMEVERLLFAGRAINSPANEVWPRLYIGDIINSLPADPLNPGGFDGLGLLSQNIPRSLDWTSLGKLPAKGKTMDPL
ncbi:hypothetical protein NFI96_000302 [Prochilodus magdalenae]|nr:hypothetical protein NFI96_000302 [Prochilodus magdalenae]